MNPTLERITMKAEIRLISKRERESLAKISECRESIKAEMQTVKANRWRKAELTRLLYFRHRVSQTVIAQFAEMRQGNISRIISQQVYGGINYYKRGAA